MLERMIIDISKWIVIILIFFIAFACSLFLIFSPFAVALKQHDALNRPSNMTEFQIIPRNLAIDRCPDHFKKLVETTSILYQIDYKEIIYNNKDESNTCKKTNDDDYDKIQTIGPHPAIYYFGRSFVSTILTTFFTLFGVIAEDKIPVNI